MLSSGPGAIRCFYDSKGWFPVYVRLVLFFAVVSVLAAFAAQGPIWP